MGERFPPQAQRGFKDLLGGFQKLQVLSLIGLPRLMKLPAQMTDGLSEPARTRAANRWASTVHLGGSAAEAAAWPQSAALARKVATLGDLPVAVLVAGQWPEIMRPSWREMQGELAAKS